MPRSLDHATVLGPGLGCLCHQCIDDAAVLGPRLANGVPARVNDAAVLQLSPGAVYEEGPIYIAYLVVAAVAAPAKTYTATNDFIRADWVLATMTRMGVPESWLHRLGSLKAAVRSGRWRGIEVPLIGIAGAIGLV